MRVVLGRPQGVEQASAAEVVHRLEPLDGSARSWSSKTGEATTSGITAFTLSKPDWRTATTRWRSAGLPPRYIGSTFNPSGAAPAERVASSSTATGRAGRLETLRNFSAKGYRFVVFGVYPDIRLSAGGGPQHMTVIQGTARAPQQVLARQDRPGLHAVVARVAVSLAVAVVAPALFVWATLVTLDIDAAVIVALAWMVGAMCWRWATGRPVSGLLLLTLTGHEHQNRLHARHRQHVYLLPAGRSAAMPSSQRSSSGSLWTARPIVARLAPDFYPIDAALAARPRVHRLFHRLTLLWGLVIIVKAGVTLWLLVSLSMVNFVVIKSSAIVALTLLAVTATIALSAIVGRQEGLLAPAQHRL